MHRWRKEGSSIPMEFGTDSAKHIRDPSEEAIPTVASGAIADALQRALQDLHDKSDSEMGMQGFRGVLTADKMQFGKMRLPAEEPPTVAAEGCPGRVCYDRRIPWLLAGVRQRAWG